MPFPFLVAADTVRQLSVAIVLLTNSFNKTLTPAEIERVHDEVAEFQAFYRQHGAGKVDFDFSLVQIDRRIQRREIAEVSPNRYYLSRENLEPELAARGFRGRFDEVIALHAWSNANPDRAVQAYGGGAVGPDGKFLGDAGFNSIPVMARDPNTIGQVLIHEVLHNIADMFTRSGMAGEFFNADEMSRNMAQLLRERPGAFLPRYSDAEMLAYAERERQGREAYPWAMQLVYYAWMLRRTPLESWNRLRYGRMAERESGNRLRPLYTTIYTSAANDRTFVAVLGGAPGIVMADASRLTRRTWTQGDFDGTAIETGSYLAGWATLRGDADSVVVPVINSGGVDVSTHVVVIRQRVASVAVPADAVEYLDEPPRQRAEPRVLADRCCGDGPPVAGARASVTGAPEVRLPAPGSYEITYTATAPGYYVHPGRTRLTVRRGWAVADDGPVTASLGTPVVLNATVREDRARDGVTVTAVLPDSSRMPLASLGDGRFSATLADGLPPGLHWIRLVARGRDGTEVVDSARVYVRPAAWVRVPAAYALRYGDSLVTDAQLWGRMGADVPGARLPLVAIVGDAVIPFTWWTSARTHRLDAAIPRGVDRIVVASLAGGIQRRPVRLGDIAARQRPVGGPPALEPIPQPVFLAAPRLVASPAIDGAISDWPAGAARALTIDSRSFLLTEAAGYRGDADLSGTVRVAWDDSTLFVAGELTDDSVVGGDTWEADRVNLVFDMNDDTTPLSYASANPPLDQWQDDDYWVFWRYGGTAVRRYGKANLDPIAGAWLATRRTATGWAFEVAIPRAALPGYLPFVGRTAGLQLFITDGDGAGSASELMWSAKWPYTADGIEWRLAELGRLLFVDAPIR